MVSSEICSHLVLRRFADCRGTPSACLQCPPHCNRPGYFFFSSVEQLSQLFCDFPHDTGQRLGQSCDNKHSGFSNAPRLRNLACELLHPKQVKDMFATSSSHWLYRSCIALLLTTASSIDQVVAQQRVDPAVRARLDREFAEAHPQPGDYLPNLELHNPKRTPIKNQATDEPITENLRYASQGDLTLVLTASLTCPKTRQHLPAMQQLKTKYKKHLGITIVYVVEAHPEKDVCPYLGVVDVTDANLRDHILYRQPKSMEDRIAIAEEFQTRYPIDGEVLIDSLANEAWRALGQSPNMALLVDSDKRVLLRQGWVEPKSLEEAIVKHLASVEKVSIKRKQHDDNTSNPELQAILKRLDPKHPSESDFVYWLKEVETNKLRILLQRYPSIVNSQYRYNRCTQDTILSIMIGRSDLEKVKIVCEAGADVNLTTGEETPLSTAIQVKSLTILQYLIANGADVKKCPLRGFKSLLHFAVWNDCNEMAIVESLVDAGLKHDVFSECAMGLQEALTKRLDQVPSSGIQFDVNGNIPLAFAVVGKQPAIVKLLLERNLAIDVQPAFVEPPVVLAVEQKDPTILEMLLNHGFDPNAGRRRGDGTPKQGQAIKDSLEEDRYPHFRLLVDAKAKLDVTEEGYSLLHLAIARRLPISFVQALLDLGTDINVLTQDYEDEDGCGPPGPNLTSETPLHIAASVLSPKHVRFLISKKAKNAELNETKLTPLAVAILHTLMASERHGKIEPDPEQVSRGLETIKALIEGGCPKDASDSNGKLIVKEFEKIIRDNVIEGEQAKARPDYGPFPYLVRDHNVLAGFDATKLTSSPLLKEIFDCLK